MKIAFVVEGPTEKAFLSTLRNFLEPRLRGRMPRFVPSVCDGTLPRGQRLQTLVNVLLQENDAVIALTDVQTGDFAFRDAADAKQQMRDWIGASESRFHPHAAQYEFEASLLPYWYRVQSVGCCFAKGPSAAPELVNHNHPPSWHIGQAFRLGGKRQYVKPRDAAAALRGADLSVAVHACPELKAIVNTILTVCGAPPID